MLQIQANPNRCINLGKRGENNAREVLFDISDLVGTFGPGKVMLVSHRCGDEFSSEEAVTMKDNHTVSWVITYYSTEKVGQGKCELLYFVDSSLAKSITFQTHVNSSLSDPVPQPETGGLYGQLKKDIGDLSSLKTQDKNSLVGAVNEIFESGGSGGASSWNALTDKPFDELNPNELEVMGLSPNRQLGIKKVPTSKITGLDTKLSEVDSAIAEKQPKGNYAIKDEIPTKTSELANDSGFATNADTDSKLAEKLNLTGGTMQGKIDMASFGIDNLPDAIKNGQPVTYKQMNDAIAGIGTVFNLKGSKPNFDALPKDGNKIGDVWFVEDESVGYIWIEKSGVPQWEKFGPQFDLSGYLTKEGLLSTTGSETNNTMSQDAITKELNKKQPTGDYSTKTELTEGLAKKSNVKVSSRDSGIIFTIT